MGKLVRIEGVRNGPTAAQFLRGLADDLERGDYGDAPRVVTVVGAKADGGITAHTHSAGLGCEPLIEILALLELGKHALLEPGYG